MFVFSRNKVSFIMFLRACSEDCHLLQLNLMKTIVVKMSKCSACGYLTKICHILVSSTRHRNMKDSSVAVVVVV